MMREELNQEQELDDDLNLNMDLSIDNEVTARIQDFLDESDDILCTKDRKQRNYIFWTIHNGKFEVILGDFIDKRTGDSNISAELNNQWERKRLCELERIAAAVDLFTLERRGKKAQEAARQAAASVSLGTVVGHIRRSVEDSRERSNVLVPVDGATRI
ncbi:hypothetical protein EDB87DRAFT_1762265 [Lactarius vividus]|nr:hypothetical protein EDB87DRAFT_1762265 [Lactarius vividus]